MQEVRSAALSAAARLLFDEGVDAVTFEKVSLRGGVSRTTLYRWWPSPAALAAEAFFRESEPVLVLRDSGDLAADLREQLQQFLALMTTTPAGAAIRGLVAAAQSDQGVREALLAGFIRPRRAIGGAAIASARDRGEIDATVDEQVVIDQIWGACYWRLLTEPDAITPEYTEALLTQALRGAGYRGGGSGRSPLR
jgi:AcrR family transcriptional regulator